jgi:ADP-heptose:LPS heptosyltransferase/SAM-dependent methyltransferase
MHELSKATQRRLHDPNFINRYFRGDGIDIGAGNDPLGQYLELFGLMSSCRSFDKGDGNAETMEGIRDETFDFVHSSHCLEDIKNPHTALKNWFRILKPGGHLLVVVPDEDMYEQGIFPSTFNPDHHWTFTIHKTRSWNLHSQNILSLVAELGEAADVIKIEQLTGTYRFGMARTDQTRTPMGEAAIEFIVRKRPSAEIKAAGCLDEMRLARAGIAPPDPAMKKIALHRPGAIGDIIMTLGLVPLLKQKYPNYEIHYFCDAAIGQGLAPLMKAAGVNKGVDCRRFADMRYEYEEAFNLIGYPLQEGYPEKPMRQHLLQYFAEEMGLDRPDQIPYFKMDPGLPQIAGRYATIHPRAGWSPYKNWSFEKWEEVIKRRDDITFFQVGAGTDRKLAGANPTFMGTELKHSINLLGNAAMHVGVDSWTNHLTNVEFNGRFVPSVILWGSTQWKAAGYDRNINISLDLYCQPCFREDPKISRMDRGPCINPPGQVFEDQKHACMAGITVESVLEAIGRIWPCGTTISTSPSA